MKFNTCYDFFLAVDAETSAAIRDASFTLTGDAEQYVKVNIQSELRPAIAYMFLHCQAQYPRLQAANPDEYGGNVFTELLTRPPQFSRPVPDSASGSASSANREKLPLLSPSFLSTWWHHTWEDFLGRCSFADAGSGFRGDRKELAQQLRPVERRVTAVLGRVESEKSLETRGRFEALLATLRQYLAGDASFPERVEVGRAAFPVPREEVRRYFWDRIEELREELRGEVEEHASDATQESALPEKEENGTTTERVQESSPEISAEAWEQMIREEMEAAGQKKDASDKMQRLAIGLSGKLPFALRAFRFMKIADPVRFPIRTRAELDVALRELREFFSHAYQSGTVNLLFRGTAKLSQQLADRAFSRIQNRAIRFLNTSGAQAAPRKSSKSADTTRVTADHEPTTGLELADVSEDSPLSGSPAADAERLSDLLTVYDVTQEQMAERLASAIADHVAHAATEALTAQGQQRTDVNSEQVAESLRACVAQATHTAESLLSAARTKSLTPQELAAIAGKAFDAALAEMQAPAEAAETMRTVLTEHREALQQASSAEDLVERVMEGGGSGARGFEERVHLVRQAQEQERSKAHHRRIGNIEEQNARKTRQLEALLSQLTQKAREAPTEPERQSAAAEAEKLHSFLQTIISMYTDPSSPPPPQE